jgi:hypothetical protein
VSASATKPQVIEAILAENAADRGTFSDSWLLVELNRCSEATRLKVSRRERKNVSCGYINPPLLDIPFEDVIFDVLHCFLRVWDKIFGLAVSDAARVGGRPALARLQEAIQVAGVSRFEFLIGCTEEERNSIMRDGSQCESGSMIIRWTNLDGNDRRKILNGINPGSLYTADELAKHAQIIDGPHRERTWIAFREITTHMLTWSPNVTPTEFRMLVYQWLLDLFGENMPNHTNEQAYGRSVITPYLHTLVCHSHRIWERHGPLMQFSCFAGEKLNHEHQKWYFNSSNHGLPSVCVCVLMLVWCQIC